MKTVTTSVGFQDPLGNLVLSGNLVLTLSQAAEVTSGGGLIAPKVVVLALNATTAKIASTQIWFNDELTPTGTTYHAELLDSGGNIIADFGQWSITGASADLSTMVPVSTFTTSLPGVVLTNPAATQTITGQSLVLTSSAPLTASVINKLYTVTSTAAGSIASTLATALAAGAPGVYIPCGTYSENLLITQACTIVGEDRTNVIINPTSIASPVISIDGSSVNSIDGVYLKRFSLPTPTGSASDGIRITGKQNLNQVVDHIVLEDLIVGSLFTVNSTGTNGFNNGISITGRSIYTTINRVVCNGHRGNGLNVVETAGGGGPGPINDLLVMSSQFNNNFNYGVKFDTAGSTNPAVADLFIDCETSVNANNTALSPSAGMLLQNVWGIHLINHYWEANCPLSADANSAHLRITGAQATPNGVTINGGWFFYGTNKANFGILNDATGSVGTWDNLGFFSGPPLTANVKVANSGTDSHITILQTRNMGTPIIVADAFGTTHVSAPSLGIYARKVINNGQYPLAANKFDLITSGGATDYATADLILTAGTLSNVTGGSLSQRLRIMSTGGTSTLTHAAGGAGQFNFLGAANKILLTNESVWLTHITATDTWQEDSVIGNKILAIPGTGANPSISFASDVTTGFLNGFLGAGSVSLDIATGENICWIANVQRNRAGELLGWSSSATPSGAASDTNMSRQGSGIVQVGTGETSNALGKIQAAVYIPAGSTSQKTESAADTNVLTVTPVAAVGSYRVRFTMAVSAQNTATLGWTATWKDANGAAQAPTNLALFTTGVAAPSLTVTAATNGNYHGSIDIDTDNSATAIVVKLTFTGTSFTAKVSATVERLI